MFVHTEVCALACVRARVFSLHVCSDISPSVCVMAGSPPAAVNTSYFQTVFKKSFTQTQARQCTTHRRRISQGL